MIFQESAASTASRALSHTTPHRTQAAAKRKSPAGFHRRGSLGCVNKKVTTPIVAGLG
jgi:hypothetical protein